jgi:ferredoxin
MKKPYGEYDVTLPAGRQKDLHVTRSLLIIGFPVYAGRVPALFRTYLENSLSCDDCQAVLVATYGNRDYDDALAEMQDVLAEKQVEVVGACAIVAQHSYTEKVGRHRPDIEDFRVLDRLAVSVLNERKPIVVPGNRPYRKGIVPPDPPYMSVADDRCTGCGSCESVCPVDAIGTNDPSRCIHCYACVKVCPIGARMFVDERLAKTVTFLESNCMAPKASELFVTPVQ